MPEAQVKFFGIELIEALQYLHSNSIIFGDLKPSNVLLNEYGQLKLSDFGNSRKLSDLLPTEEEDEAAPKGHTGTPYYMSPELFQDDGVISFSSDLWSLGCILFELATGRPPFYCSSLQDLIKQITEDKTPSVPGFSKEFNDMLSSLLEKDPVNRMSWQRLKTHPFWGTHEFRKAEMPR